MLCSHHNTEATLEHVATCAHLQALPNVSGYRTLIEGKRFSDWSAQEQLETSICFAALHIKVQQLLDLGVLRKVPRLKAASRKASTVTTTESTDSTSTRSSSIRKKVRFAADEDSPMTETEAIEA